MKGNHMQFEDIDFDDMAVLRAAADGNASNPVDINKPAECSAYLRGYYRALALRLRAELDDCRTQQRITDDIMRTITHNKDRLFGEINSLRDDVALLMKHIDDSVEAMECIRDERKGTR